MGANRNMLRKLSFVFAFLFFLNFVVAGIEVNPNEVSPLQNVLISVDFPSYDPYVYIFYYVEESSNLTRFVHTAFLPCDNPDNLCSGKKEFSYFIPASFYLRSYYVAVFSPSDNKWKIASFNVVPGRCSDGTEFGQCSSEKPKYCYEGNLIDDNSLCGCPSSYNLFLNNGSCAESLITINPAPILVGDLVKITVDSKFHFDAFSFYNLNTKEYDSTLYFECLSSCTGKHEKFISSFDSLPPGNYTINMSIHEGGTIGSESFQVLQKCTFGSYSDEGSCYNGQKNRTIISSYPEGCSNRDVELISECSGNIGDNCILDSHCFFGLECKNSKCGASTKHLGKNKKDMGLYSNKEVFLMSDKNWKEVLPFVSVTTWNGEAEGDVCSVEEDSCSVKSGFERNVCLLSNFGKNLACEFINSWNSRTKKYPVLIYHEENNFFGNPVFDADSIIYFMQQYSPDRVTIVGDSLPDLDNSLIATKDFGAGLSINQIKKINASDYLNYWDTFDTVVYVEENYELALLASTYSSLINAPLIIEGSDLYFPTIFVNRKVICVGNVFPEGGSCFENYDVESLKTKYKSVTNTNKIILVNPGDYDNEILFNIDSYFGTEKSGYIRNTYSKTSMMAPFLAAAKQELIVSLNQGVSDESHKAFKVFVNNEINKFAPDYLTIMASPLAIPSRIDEPDAVGEIMNAFSDSANFWRALDASYYADTNRDDLPNIAVGRIAGISSSDVSSYIARILFFEHKTNRVRIMASSFGGLLKKLGDGIGSYFRNAGFDTSVSTSEAESYSFPPSYWENQDLIYYIDHGNEYWAGIYSTSLPLINNSIIVASACSTVSTSDDYSFWAWAIRNGAVGFFGKVSNTWLNSDDIALLNYLYRDDLNLGNAFKKSYTNLAFQKMAIYIGDPTLDTKPKSLLKEDINAVKSLVCLEKNNFCGFGIDCCPGTTCSLWTCKSCYGAGKKLSWPYLVDEDPNRCCNGWKSVKKKICNICSHCTKGVCWPWNWRIWESCKYCGSRSEEDHRECI